MNVKYESHDDYVKGIIDETYEFYIDNDDYYNIKHKRWKYDKNGYLYFINERKVIFMHRYILSMYYDLNEKIVDHINHKVNDNRKENLRVCTKKGNNQNRQFTGNKSGIKGVDIDERYNRYRVRIHIEGKYITIGSFDNFRDAVISRVQSENKYYGEFRSQDQDEVIEELVGMSIVEIINHVSPQPNTKKKTSVLQYDLDDNFIKKWESVRETQDGGFTYQAVRRCCDGKRKTHAGFKWTYANREEESDG